MTPAGEFLAWSAVTPSPVARPLPEEMFVSLMMRLDENEDQVREAVGKARVTGCSIPGKNLESFLMEETGVTVEDLLSLYARATAR